MCQCCSAIALGPGIQFKTEVASPKRRVRFDLSKNSFLSARYVCSEDNVEAAEIEFDSDVSYDSEVDWALSQH